MKALGLGLFDGPFLLQSPPNPGTFGPVRWWDADSLRDDWGLTNDAIIAPEFFWRDKSSNGLHARSTASPLNTQPQFKSDELSSINGRPVVRLQGTKRLLFDGGDLILGDFTVLVVYAAVNDSMILSHDGFNRQIRINRSGVNKASWFSGESGTENISNLLASNPSFPRMVGYRRINYSALNRDVVFFDNATLVNDDGATGVSNVLFGINQIGVIDGGPLNIDIAELAIYNKALTDSEIQTLYTQYFKPKFALP